MNSNEQAVAICGIPSEREFSILQNVAKTASISGLYGNMGGEQKIFMILLAARELGVPPVQALNGGIWNIQGKIEISARLMNSMIRRAGHSIRITYCDATKCVVEGKRKDSGDSFVSQFTIEDAIKAGLANRGPWKTYTEDMLYSRAMSRLARRLFPDVIGSAYVEGEIRDAKSEANELVVEVQESSPQETDEEAENLAAGFVQNFPELDQSLAVTYMNKYSSHWKKTMSQSIEDYQDREKFLLDFGKWKAKEEKKSQST